MGIVYVLTNSFMPGLVKIGLTERNKITTRMNELFSTGVPAPFNLEHAVQVDNARVVEKWLHRIFAPQRLGNREFFEIHPQQVIAALSMINGDEVTSALAEDMLSNSTAEYRSAIQHSQQRKARFKFSEIGIPPGSVLQFVPDPGIEAKVLDDHRVMHNGLAYTLTGLTNEVGTFDSKRRPGTLWTYNGFTLRMWREMAQKPPVTNAPNYTMGR